MKYKDIITLANNGVLAITAHDLPAIHAYKVMRFKKALRLAIHTFQIDDAEFASAVDITNTAEFDIRLNELRKIQNPTDSEKNELKEAISKVVRLKELRDAHMEEDIDLQGVIPMPYEYWHILQNENKAIDMGGKSVDALSGLSEEILEGILWIAPEG